jgi:hypothetical protein
MVLVIVTTLVGQAFAAHQDASPAIDVSSAAITVTNGPASCFVDSSDDKVLLQAGGASDTDCAGNQSGEIDLDATEWDASSGVLDATYGETNGWKATSVDSAVGGTVIAAAFNDKDADTLHDDASTPVNLAATGFKVGCELTTSKGGLFVLYSDSSHQGDPISDMKGTLGWFNRTAAAEEQDAAIATWKIVVTPQNTAIKGKVKMHGSADTAHRPGLFRCEPEMATKTIAAQRTPRFPQRWRS